MGSVAVSSLHECPGCGLFQTVPHLEPETRARCDRCGVILRRGRADMLNRATALAFAGLVLMTIAATMTMMTVQKAGITHDATLIDGPLELVRRGLWELAVVVFFVTMVAPFGLLGGRLYMLVMLRTRQPPRHLRVVYKALIRLAPWSMIEVFLLGAFVAYTKLQDLVQIGVGAALIALVVLTFVMTWLAWEMQAHTVWDEMQRRGVVGPRVDAAPPPPPQPRLPANPLSCEDCGLVQSHPVAEGGGCARCGSALHRRKPNSMGRTAALCFAAAVLYIPANYYPVLTVMQLGAGEPSTILGGVRELIEAKQWPLVVLVFTASVAVPMLKLVGLAFMLVCVQVGAGRWLRERTKLFGFILQIGRWSMVDIFMESLLGALVRFGTVVTIEPGAGAVAFCAVVILTMFAAESFDPRLMWDAAAAKADRVGAGPEGALPEPA